MSADKTERNATEEIKGYFRDIMKMKLPGVSLSGPKDNVLMLEDWDKFIEVGSYLRSKGLYVKSPGGYGYSAPRSRQLVHALVWKFGSLCSVAVKRRLFVFDLPDSIANDFDIVTKNKEIEVE